MVDFSAQYRLIGARIAYFRKLKRYTQEELAHALQKNWKVAHITKEEAKFMDFNLKLKSTMPKGWDFMTGRPETRLEAAGIRLIPNNPH